MGKFRLNWLATIARRNGIAGFTAEVLKENRPLLARVVPAEVDVIEPEIEVIILTGHGSEADKELCLQLGAFAYLQKPVDVEELSATIKRANEKIQENRASKK